MMAIKEVLQRFATNTTMHGTPRVINARSTLARVLWSLVCLGAGCMFCLQMSEVLRRYFSYPKKVTVEVVPTPVPFPSISICNMRNLDVHVLNSLNRLFLVDDRPLSHINTTGNAFIDAYMTTVAKYAPLFWTYQEQYQEVFQEIFSRTMFSANIPHEVIALAAVQLEGFVVNCHNAGRRCNTTRDFRQFFDPYYYNCFTYTIPEPAPVTDDDESLSEGIDNGWSAIFLSGTGMLDKNTDIRMLPGLHEWRSPVSANEGVRVVIHPPHTQPYPFTEGFDVPPGFSTSFGIRPRRNIRIGPPHGNCTHRNPFDRASRRYRLIACQKMCLQHYVISHCGCADVSLPKLPSMRHGNISLCRDDSAISPRCMFNATNDCLESLFALHARIRCARATKAKMTKHASAMDACSCYAPCDDVTYDVSYSLSKWPAFGYEGDAAYFDIFGIEQFSKRFNRTETIGKYALFRDYFTVEARERTMQDFVRINVYIADSNVVKTTESPDYTSTQLVSDIGGQLGLWVGISIITLAEVFELFVDIFRYVTSPKTFSNNRRNSMPNSRDNRKRYSNNNIASHSRVPLTDTCL